MPDSTPRKPTIFYCPNTRSYYSWCIVYWSKKPLIKTN